MDKPPAPAPIAYDGPDALHAPIFAALRRVVDPEVALNIVDVGLVYGVVAGPAGVQVRMTMTSAACPVADIIMDDVQWELSQALPEDTHIGLELVWDPPWSQDRMSDRAKAFMGW